MTQVSVSGIVSKIVTFGEKLWAKLKERFDKKHPGGLHEVSDEELSAWYEGVRKDAKLGENGFNGEEYHDQLHVAAPTPLWRVRELLRRAGYTAEMVRGDAEMRGSRKHNEWHLTHPGQGHG